MPRQAMRVRHHTDDRGLEGIRSQGAIHVSRGWANTPTGVHVELGPFGSTRRSFQGGTGPINQMMCHAEGAYVEFDAPPSVILYSCGTRNTGIIPADDPFPIAELNPVYVKVRKVRRYWWEFWRTRPE